MAADLAKFRVIFFFYTENDILSVLIRISSMICQAQHLAQFRVRHLKIYDLKIHVHHRFSK